jgi:hypothetical protein
MVTKGMIKKFNNIKHHFLALGMQYHENVIPAGLEYENFKRWAITDVQQFDNIEFTEKEVILFFKILAACIIAEPQYISESSRNLIVNAFVVLFKKILDENKITQSYLLSSRVILERPYYLAPDIKATITSYYLKAHRQLFGSLPSLVDLTLEKILLNDFSEAASDYSSGMSMIEVVYREHPVKTILLQSRFNHFSLLFKPVDLQSSSGEQMDVNKKRNHDTVMENSDDETIPLPSKTNKY